MLFFIITRDDYHYYHIVVVVVVIQRLLIRLPRGTTNSHKKILLDSLESRIVEKRERKKDAREERRRDVRVRGKSGGKKILWGRGGKKEGRR